MGCIVVKNYIPNCLTNGHGEELKKMILQEDAPIVLDFTDIDGVSTSFVNSSFVDLLYLKGIDYIKSIKIINSSKNMNQTILRRIKFEQDKILIPN